MARLAGYAVVIALLFAGLVLIEISSADGLRLWVQSDMAPTLGTSEWSPVEWLQLLSLVLVVALALQGNRWRPRQQALGGLMAVFAVAALIRELDFFLDFYVVDHLWQVLIAFPLAVGVVIAGRSRGQLTRSLRESMATPAMTLIYCGLIVLVFANLLGHAPFWQSILGDAYHRSVKLAAEEMTELLGYCLWLAGQFEYALDCRSRHALAADSANRAA